MERVIKNPYWSREDKTQVVCQFHYEDGTVMEAAVMDTAEGNPDWQEIMATFTTADIDAMTDKVKISQGKITQKDLDEKTRLAAMTPEEIEADKILKEEESLARHRARQEEEKEQEARQKNEILFQVKLDSFDIEEIKNSTNRELKSRIRKAKSIIEVQALTAVLLMKELDSVKPEVTE